MHRSVVAVLAVVAALLAGGCSMALEPVGAPVVPPGPFAPGESFGLLGPNGAGKSTTMKMIGAVSTRTSGRRVRAAMQPDQSAPPPMLHRSRGAGRPRSPS